MPSYILDTNHLSATLMKTSVLRERIEQSYRKGSRFCTSYEIICELEAAIQRSKKVVDNRRYLRFLLQKVRLQVLELETTRLFGSILIDLRNRGRFLSQVDMMTAALARQHGLIILTTDRDFEALADLHCENWLA